MEDTPLLDAAEIRSLAAFCRSIARRRDVLFHGTRTPDAILRSGTLKLPPCGDWCVSFSRSPEVAAYWATLPRKGRREIAAIFILDRISLRQRYRLRPADFAQPAFGLKDEMEERIVGRDVVDLDRHLIATVALGARGPYLRCRQTEMAFLPPDLRNLHRNASYNPSVR